jgi:endonuclease YncB( thermonuclease family)
MSRTGTLSLSLTLASVLFAGCSSVATPSGLSLPYRRHTRNITTPLMFEGRVVGVQDGDTITVLDSSDANHKIRLQGIDAPEKGQAFGTRSGQNLSEAVFNKIVTIQWSKHDRYGRILGKVLLNSRDVCLDQVTAGMAWHYKYYQDEQAPEDRELYAADEIAARAGKIGLWIDPNPVPPWDFRRQR